MILPILCRSESCKVKTTAVSICMGGSFSGKIAPSEGAHTGSIPVPSTERWRCKLIEDEASQDIYTKPLLGELAQMARALDLHSRGHRFDSDILHNLHSRLLTKL